MSKPMLLSLKAGERLFINGAVLRVNRRVTVELLNTATFLLEAHVLQPEECTTPLRQLYFSVQTIIMDPAHAGELRRLFTDLYASTAETFRSHQIVVGLADVADMVAMDRPFDALRILRGLMPLEDTILEPRASETKAA
jgi:flagellar protein FlbT